ncbi:MAG TPA: hydrogenase maturation protease [Bryobacteraceae bacterium]|jgi:hydrogenase maturation protease|nr:hydrogenase maturation protease [Bryobacteraceae bacterium]
MGASILIAGIGNIFQGDDAFGVEVVRRLAGIVLPEHVRVMDIGIRSVDLGFALLDPYDLTILVDATARGGAPGTLYTIEIASDDIPNASDESSMVNSHGLNPVLVLALARSMGATFNRVLLIGCEPMILDRDASGHIGLSEVVEAAVYPAVETIRQLVESFSKNEVVPNTLENEEVLSHEFS